PSGIQYETPGIYEVTLVTANNSGSDTLTKKCLIEVIMTTSTVEVNEMAISVYPNPTAGIVNIDFPDVEQSQITVSDIVGRTIFQTDHLTDKQIDLSGFKSGVYVIRIQTEEGYLTRRIIKK
ncbi:MAG: T9SS type A sorting domain-containing protein, partial [Mameliella sp.]|nr:T9SS type A sorting domain-containing protein [Phaeodactylibacter sp.]